MFFLVTMVLLLLIRSQEYELEQRREQEQWDSAQKRRNQSALQRMRCLMPASLQALHDVTIQQLAGGQAKQSSKKRTSVLSLHN